MDYKEIFGLIIPLILIIFGLLLRKTQNEKYQFATKYWRLLIALGLLSFLLKLAALLLS